MSASPLPLPNQDRAVRYLRRRLWRAFQEENAEDALRAYTATRTDCAAWMIQDARLAERARLEEEAALLKNKQERPEARPVLLKKFGALFRSTNGALRTKDSKRNNEKPSNANRDLANAVQPECEEKPCGDDQSCLLQVHFNPSDSFTADDKHPSDICTDEPPGPEQLARIPKSRINRLPRPSLTFRWGGGRLMCFEEEKNEDSNEDAGSADESDTETTPLHEAARIGSPSLVRLMLSQRGMPNHRNGNLRTALHMAAGGLTRLEDEQRRAWRISNESGYGESAVDHRLDEDALGIRAPETESKNASQVFPQTVTTGKTDRARRGVASLLVRTLRRSNKQLDEEIMTVNGSGFDAPKLDTALNCFLAAERLETVLEILSWCYPDDHSPAAGEGTSVNSVDSRQRTALHYASELGRSDICMAIVSAFGAMLTVVDETSRTPCELAGEQSHHELAARLEARALLFVDPYGMDDDLMASIIAGDAIVERIDPEEHDSSSGRIWKHCGKKLRQPFSLFATWSHEEVQEERESRVDLLLDTMRSIISQRNRYYVDDDLLSRTNFQPVFMATEKSFDFPRHNEPCPSASSAALGLSDSANRENDATRPVQVDSPAVSENAADRHVSIASDRGAGSSSVLVEREGATQTNSIDEETRKGWGLHSVHAEKFLLSHDFSVVAAAKSFRDKLDSEEAMSDVGISFSMNPQPQNAADGTKFCLICCEDYTSRPLDWKGISCCKHGFCKGCLGEYLQQRTTTREDGLCVTCPHHECRSLLTLGELRDLSTAETYSTMVETANSNFVLTATDMRYCPHPGCTGVIKRFLPNIVKSASIDHGLVSLMGAVCSACGIIDENSEIENVPVTYDGVRDLNYTSLSRDSSQPLRAHRFCFACGSYEVHWPADCELLEQWKAKVAEEMGPMDGSDEAKYEDAAQKLWLKINTRPCPKCDAPIEKDEGCNHMTCKNRHCKYEFCWICRQDWKLHSTATGGFFQCNKWRAEGEHEFYADDPSPVQPGEDEMDADAAIPAMRYGTATHSNYVIQAKKRGMERFLHHYRRWNAHRESASLEIHMGDTVRSRLAPLVAASREFRGDEQFDFGGKGLSFVHAAFTELLECRWMLKNSYAFAYFRYPPHAHLRRGRLVKARQLERMTFEQFQADLEIVTEHLSDIVARKHLRATQTQIMFLTAGTAEKRRDFSDLMLTILNDRKREEKLLGRLRDRAPSPTQQSVSVVDESNINERVSVLQVLTSTNRETVAQELFPETAVRAGLILPYEPVDEGFDAWDAIETVSRGSSVPEDRGFERLATTVDDYPWTQWSCSACTYTNTGGTRCAMCETLRE